MSKKKVGLFGTASSSGSQNASSSKSQNKSLFKKFKVSKDSSNSVLGVSSEGSSVEGGVVTARQAMLDDRHRRRFFNHYDIGSLCATLNLSSMMKSIDRISNCQTGASAASAALLSLPAAVSFARTLPGVDACGGDFSRTRVSSTSASVGEDLFLACLQPPPCSVQQGQQTEQLACSIELFC